MDVFLLRTSLLDDGAHLSAEGRRIVRAIGNKIRLTEEPAFDRVVTSGAPAAVQTAELFADRVDFVGVVEVLPQLTGSVPAEVTVPLVVAKGSCILVVADEPDLARLGAFLVGRPTFPPSAHGQVSMIRDRRPEWCLRPGELARAQLLIA